MVTDEILDRLRYKGEGSDLDFKQAQYKFSGASDHEKSELLKDILAMANAYREGTGYILIGFKDQPPHPAQVVGISAPDHIDDAAIQQFVNSKVQPKLEFRYEERLFDGKTVAVIAIPKQQRPFFLSKGFGKLQRSVVYLRRGSSTDEASPLEVAKMGQDDNGRGKPCVDLIIHDESNSPLKNEYELRFLSYNEHKLPDYDNSVEVDMGFGYVTRMPSPMTCNSGYWRDGAKYHQAINRLILIRLSLSNKSDFVISDAKLEVTCSVSDLNAVEMMRADDLPEKPSADWSPHFRGFPHVLERQSQRIEVDDRGSAPICHIRLGGLLPGEMKRAQDDLAILPAMPGRYVIQIRILAAEINPPIVHEHAIDVSGQSRVLDFNDILGLMYTNHLSDENQGEG